MSNINLNDRLIVFYSAKKLKEILSNSYNTQIRLITRGIGD